MLKNWKTSLAGIVAILVGLWHCYSMGKIDVECVAMVFTGGGLLAAKDHDVTGGSRS